MIKSGIWHINTSSRGVIILFNLCQVFIPTFLLLAFLFPWFAFYGLIAFYSDFCVSLAATRLNLLADII